LLIPGNLHDRLINTAYGRTFEIVDRSNKKDGDGKQTTKMKKISSGLRRKEYSNAEIAVRLRSSMRERVGSRF